MKSKHLCYPILLLSIFLFSCKKEKAEEINVAPTSGTTNSTNWTQGNPGGTLFSIPDTTFPSSYLPAWPGSWWQYSDNSQITTDSVYHLVAVLEEMTTWGQLDTVKFSYLPKYNGKFLFGYNQVYAGTVSGPGGMSRGQWPLLSETAGYSWTMATSVYGSDYGKIIVKDTSILLSTIGLVDSVILTRHFHTSYAVSPAITFPVRDFYYAKNIGLVRTDEYNFPNTQPAIKSEITNYFINH